MELVFSEFLDIKEVADGWGQAGDVKYHLSQTFSQKYQNGHEIKLSMLANPSHLECINPVVYGSTRAIQDYSKDTKGL